jgi:hypothetical protein
MIMAAAATAKRTHTRSSSTAENDNGGCRAATTVSHQPTNKLPKEVVGLLLPVYTTWALHHTFIGSPFAHAPGLLARKWNHHRRTSYYTASYPDTLLSGHTSFRFDSFFRMQRLVGTR